MIQSNGLITEALQMFQRLVEGGGADAVLFSILVKGLSRHREEGAKRAMEAYRWLKEGGGACRTMQGRRGHPGEDAGVQGELYVSSHAKEDRENGAEEERQESFSLSSSPHFSRGRGTLPNEVRDPSAVLPPAMEGAAIADAKELSCPYQDSRPPGACGSVKTSTPTMGVMADGRGPGDLHSNSREEGKKRQEEEGRGRRVEKRVDQQGSGGEEAVALSSCYVQALNTICFNSLLHLCVSNGNLSDAVELFKDMEKHPRAKPDLVG